MAGRGYVWRRHSNRPRHKSLVAVVSFSFVGVGVVVSCQRQLLAAVLPLTR
jgi:hypothetical protein